MNSSMMTFVWDKFDPAVTQGISNAREAAKNAMPRRSQLFVGSSVLSLNDGWFSAGNVETLWQRSHHAEENAIMKGVSCGARKFSIIVVSAPRKLFTPCGSCCDLVMEFGDEECLFVHDNPETQVGTIMFARDLMPHYPTKV